MKITQIGHLIRAYNGDAIKICDEQIYDESVDLILTDPPYLSDDDTNYRATKDVKAGTREALMQQKILNDKGPDGKVFLKRYFQRCYKILAPDSAMYCFCKMEGPGGEDLLAFFKQAIRKAGFSIANTIIWRKDNWSAGDLDGAFAFQYEVILFCHKGRPLLRGKRYPDVWDFARVPEEQRIHRHQKPLDLLTRCIESSSDRGNVIFDGCAGSGSTGLAAHMAEREAILCELDPNRYEAMVQYLEGKVLKRDMFAGL